jgi:hypothetical protein
MIAATGWRSGGQNTSVNGVTLSEATHGYGIAGGGGAAHAATAGNGADGLPGYVKIEYEA